MTKITIAANLVVAGAATVPNYEHDDCEHCVFLGRSFHDGTCDVWFCTEDHMLMWRQSHEGPDYRSMSLSSAAQIAEREGPGSAWSQAVSRHDDWQGSGQGNTIEWETKPLPQTYRVQSRVNGETYSGRELETYREALDRQDYLHSMGIPARVQTPIGRDEINQLVWQNVGP